MRGDDGGIDDEAFRIGSGEAGLRCDDVIASRLKGIDAVRAVTLGVGGADFLGVDVGGGDLGAGNDGTRAVVDDTGEDALAGLSINGAG